MSNDAPIGVFDSGIGGLTVLQALRHVLPQESYVYFGDTARLPYGTKSPETIVQYAAQCAAFLLSHNVKAIVVACNSASAHAVEYLRARCKVPVIEMIEPGARAALRIGTRIGVLGTRATVASMAYDRAIRSLNPDALVVSQASPLLVSLAEEQLVDGDIAERVVARYVLPLLEHDLDGIVLGCTHFPLLREVIAAVCGRHVALVDSGVAAAEELCTVLGEQAACAPEGSDPLLQYYVSDSTTHAGPWLRALIGDVPLQCVRELPPGV